MPSSVCMSISTSGVVAIVPLAVSTGRATDRFSPRTRIEAMAWRSVDSGLVGQAHEFDGGRILFEGLAGGVGLGLVEAVEGGGVGGAGARGGDADGVHG